MSDEVTRYEGPTRGQPVVGEQGDLRSGVLTALSDGLGDRLVAVVLFGSRARGEARPDSDWDLLVVAEGLPSSPFQRRAYVRSLLPADCRARVSLLPRAPAELLEHLSSLALDIAVDGQIWYDPSGRAAQRLHALRRQLEKAGLRRRRQPAGEIWIGAGNESGWAALERLA